MFHIASESTIPKIPDHLSPSAQDFIRACFVKDPAHRPSAENLLRHPFFNVLPRSASHYTWLDSEKQNDSFLPSSFQRSDSRQQNQPINVNVDHVMTYPAPADEVSSIHRPIYLSFLAINLSIYRFIILIN
jgi:serine/threonine protein kinase